MILVRSVIGRVAMKGEPSEGESFFLGPVPYSDLPKVVVMVEHCYRNLAASEENSTDSGLSFLLEMEAFWSQPIHQSVQSKWPSPAIWVL